MTNEYRQIIIEDPECISGKSLSRLLGLLSINIAARYVVVDSVTSTSNDEILKQYDYTTLPVDELLSILDSITQIEWGDFYLYKTKEKADLYVAGLSYNEKIASCAALVRAIDNTYFYIYIKENVNVDGINLEYKINDQKILETGKLEFPY